MKTVFIMPLLTSKNEVLKLTSICRKCPRRPPKTPAILYIGLQNVILYWNVACKSAKKKKKWESTRLLGPSINIVSVTPCTVFILNGKIFAYVYCAIFTIYLISWPQFQNTLEGLPGPHLKHFLHIFTPLAIILHCSILYFKV